MNKSITLLTILALLSPLTVVASEQKGPGSKGVSQSPKEVARIFMDHQAHCKTELEMMSKYLQSKEEPTEEEIGRASCRERV